jgi:hypothetical protein
VINAVRRMLALNSARERRWNRLRFLLSMMGSSWLEI